MSNCVVNGDVSIDNVTEVLTKSPRLVKRWNKLGKALGLPEEVLKDLKMNSGEDVGRFTGLLRFWARAKGKEATIESLAAGVEMINYMGMADALLKAFPSRENTRFSDYRSRSTTDSDSRRCSSSFNSSRDSSSRTSLSPTPPRASKSTTPSDAVKVASSDIYFFSTNDIGYGGSSNVFEGYFQSPGWKAAVKRVRGEYFKVIDNEIEVWSSLSKLKSSGTVNIVQLFAWKRVDDACFFAMELATSNLRGRLTHDSPPSRCLVLKFIQEAAQGLKWLHGKNIIHRDIKPENILIFREESGDEMAKLGDFGISRQVSPGHVSGTTSMGKGTEVWMSPEGLDAAHKGIVFKNTTSLDIFSLGMTAYFALSGGTHPFRESDEYLLDTVSNIKDYRVIPKDIQGSKNQTGNNLLQWMMQKDAKMRPAISHVLQHPTFWDLKKTLKFLIDISNRSSSKEDRDWKALWNSLDIAYQKSCRANNLDWTTKVEPQLLQRRSKGKKIYEGSSLKSLIELIRDKSQHFPDMKPKLLEDEFFGNSGKGLEFDEEKYTAYFLKRFPDIVTVLFCVLVSIKDHPCLDKLREDYFKDFPVDCRWADGVATTLFSNLGFPA